MGLMAPMGLTALMGLTEHGELMTKIAFFLLFSLFPRGASAQSPNSSTSQSMSIYPSYFQKLPRTTAGIKRFLFSYCQNHVSLKQLMAFSRSSTSKNPHGRCAGRKGYQLCLALASENPRLCRDLSAGCMPSLVEDCYRDYNAAEFFVKMSGPDVSKFSRFCLMAMKEDHMNMPQKNMPRACLIFRQAVLNHWTPGNLCRKLEPLGFPQCRKNSAFLLGPQSCPSSDTDGICEADTAIFKVLASRNDITACGSSPICHAAFSHSPVVCKQMSGQFASEYCQEMAGSQFRKMISEEKRFRQYNRLSPYKEGDLLIDYLPPQEKEKYYNKSLMKKHDSKLMKSYLKNGPPPNSQGGGDVQNSGE